MIRHALLFVLCSGSACVAEEESPLRTWTSTAGTEIEARMVSLSGDSVTLERQDGGDRLTVGLEQLSEADRDHLLERKRTEAATGARSVEGIDAEPGKISEPISCGEWSYRLYLPEAFHTGRSWPVCFVMSPGGDEGGGTLHRYIPGAERLGCVLAVSVESRNDLGGDDAPVSAMTEHVYDHLPVEDAPSFSSGMSGGSRMAYYLAETERRVDGVLACGSGSGVYPPGGSFRQADLRSSTYVYSLIGTRGYNRYGAVETHGDLPEDHRLRFFPGGHDWAGEALIGQGMARVLGELLKREPEREERARMRELFAVNMWAWTREKAGTEPWEAARWAEFLADFPGDPQVRARAAKLVEELDADPDAERGRDAEGAIREFAEEYYGRGWDSMEAAKTPDPDREEEAAERAARYEGLPHAELLRALAKAAL